MKKIIYKQSLKGNFHAKLTRLPYKTNQDDPQIRAYKEAVEKGRQDHHVVYKKDSWVVIKGGAQRPIDTFGTQQEAIAKAKSIAQTQGTAVFIHGVDGRIRETESYESNPFPPQDSKVM